MDKRRIIIPIVVVLAIVSYFVVKNVKSGNPDEITGSGTIEVTEVDIGTKLMARISVINNDEGDSVKKGDLLVVLEHEDLDAQLQQFTASSSAAKEQIIQLEAQFKNAEDSVNRARDLFKSGSYSQAALDSAETQYKVVSAQLNSAKQLNKQTEAQVRYIKSQISNAYLYAPVPGVILKRNAETGEMASPGMSILTVGDLSRPWLKIYIAETDLGKVKLGNKVVVETDSFSKKKYEGKVTNISSRSEFTPKNVQTKDDRTRLVYAVKISLSNENQELKPGMPADAIIYVKNN